MASVKRKKKRTVCTGTCPPFNIYKGRRGAAEEEYNISVELVEDDSPIVRASVRLHRTGTSIVPAAGSAILIPVVFLETLQAQLQAFIPAVREELDRRGVKRSKYV